MGRKTMAFALRELLFDCIELALHKQRELAWPPLGCWSPVLLESSKELQSASAASTNSLIYINRVGMSPQKFPAPARCH